MRTRHPMRRITAGLAAATTLLLVASCSNSEDGQAVKNDDQVYPVEAAKPVDSDEQPEQFTRVIASSNVDATRYAYPVPENDGDDDQNYVDLFLPEGDHPDKSVPLVILVHGGAWQSQIGADSFTTFARRLAERGFAVYNVEYRRVGSGGGYPTTFHDVAAALDYVPAVAADNPSVNTDDATVVGHSAGGQLAAWVGTRHKLADDEVGSKPAFRPTRVVSLAGPLDMRVAVADGDDRIVTALGGEPDEVPERYESVDPIQNLDPQTPVVAMAGSNDHVVPPVVSSNYIDALNDDGGDGTYIEIPDTNHVTIVDPANPAFIRVLETISRAARDNHR